ncbi:hypothetical protein EOD42_02105 [Rhodovarius crocodyli]|uniref:Uncharacterized protein n=1 Tax=Rhodovarius crocodyli TaxID=1979269 RepID=A0A437MMP2_9PROT|nr:hypothetical protein [Rhodovarius crocodyli]RVT98927.1 hypothetical protein EOD42_02105 [Rhodovarius crocodyli]
MRLGLLLVLVPVAALAQGTPESTSERGAATFVTHCVRHAGRPDTLRDMLARTGIRPVPPEYAQRLWRGVMPPTVYNVSVPDAGMILAVEENGICTLIVPRADAGAVITQLEARLREANIRFQIGTVGNSPHVRSQQFLLEAGRPYSAVVNGNTAGQLQTILQLTPRATPAPQAPRDRAT